MLSSWHRYSTGLERSCCWWPCWCPLPCPLWYITPKARACQPGSWRVLGLGISISTAWHWEGMNFVSLVSDVGRGKGTCRGLQTTTGPGVHQIWGPLGLHCFASPHWFCTMDMRLGRGSTGTLVMSQRLLQAAPAHSPEVLTSSEVLLVVAVAVHASELGPGLLHTHVFLRFQVTNYDSVTGLPLIQLWNLMGDEVGILIYMLKNP